MLEKLMNNPYAWLFLSALSIFSVVFGIYTWYASKQRKEISMHYVSDVLVKAGKQQVKNLEILYNGKPIADLTSTKFYIWNSGNQVLYNSDIVSSRPLSICADNATCILDTQILKVSDSTNAFCVFSQNANSARFDFDYVEPGAGILVQVLHTGESINLRVDCKIKGGKEVKDCTPTSKNRKISKTDKFLNFVASEFAFSVWIIVTLFGVFLSVNMLSALEKEKITLGGFLVFFALSAMFFGIGLKLSKSINKFANNIFHRAIPQDLLAPAKKK